MRMLIKLKSGKITVYLPQQSNLLHFPHTAEMA